MKSPTASPRASQPSGPEPDNKQEQGPAAGWLAGLFRALRPRLLRQAPGASDANDLFAFPSEADRLSKPAPLVAVVPKPQAKSRALVWKPAFGAALAFVVIAIVGAVAARQYHVLQFLLRPQPGHLSVNTRPEGSEVLVDGQPKGVTPLTLALSSGPHTITVRNEADERLIPLTITAGAEVTQYFEMKRAEPASVVGDVSVLTDPPHARVLVDGQPRGISPVVVGNLTPGEHKISVANDTGSAAGTVAVTAGSTVSVMFSLSQVSGPVGGWLSISSPFAVDIVEHDDVIGSGASRIMLAAGRHDLTLANRSLGYEVAKRVDVTAGKTTPVRIEAPKVSVSVNARPWAEVLLDGTAVGETPIANLLVSVGSHEVLFRHPQFSEQKQTVLVTVKGPNRIAADLTK